jgi:hypothetical protein
MEAMEMTLEERRAWIYGAVTTIAYAVYAVIVGGRMLDAPIAEVAYVETLLWTIGGAIVGNVVLQMFFGGVLLQGKTHTDQRDRQIGRFGDYVGQWFLVIGGVGGLVMSIVELHYFWISNAIYLGFVLSAILSSIAKVFAYRRGFHPW